MARTDAPRNLDHVMEDHDPAFLDVLEELVDAMEGGR